MIYSQLLADPVQSHGLHQSHNSDSIDPHRHRDVTYFARHLETGRKEFSSLRMCIIGRDATSQNSLVWPSCFFLANKPKSASTVPVKPKIGCSAEPFNSLSTLKVIIWQTAYCSCTPCLLYSINHRPALYASSANIPHTQEDLHTI